VAFRYEGIEQTHVSQQALGSRWQRFADPSYRLRLPLDEDYSSSWREVWELSG
jgi:hypothetical protein